MLETNRTLLGWGNFKKCVTGRGLVSTVAGCPSRLKASRASHVDTTSQKVGSFIQGVGGRSVGRLG